MALLVPAALGVTACDGPDGDTPIGADPVVVTIESQTCRRPQPRLGVGTLLADGVALTAAHVVDEQLRRLEVDGRAARVVATSAATDLALVAADTASATTVRAAGDWFATIGTAVPVAVEARTAATIETPTGRLPTTVDRAITLRVDDVSAGVVHDRRALELATVVEPGDSGAPVVTADGTVVGVVVLSRPAADVSYAVRVPALPHLVDPAGRSIDSTTPPAEGVARSDRCT